MLSQESKGNTKIVTDSGDSGRKKGVQGGKEEEEAGQENRVALQEIKQTRWHLIDCFHGPVFFVSWIFSAITTPGSPLKPTLHIGHTLCSIKNLWAYSGRLAALNHYIKAGFHLPFPQCRHLITRFVLCTAAVFHRPYLFWYFSSSFKFGWNWVPKFLRGIAECTERETTQSHKPHFKGNQAKKCQFLISDPAHAKCCLTFQQQSVALRASFNILRRI